MTWAGAALALFKLATALLAYAERRSLMRQGELEHIIRQRDRTNELLDKIARARLQSDHRSDDERRRRLSDYANRRREHRS